MNSWKTTLFGLMAIIGGGIVAAFELHPATLTCFPTWLPGLGFLLSTIGAGGIGLAARDNDKTSEQVGASSSSSSGSGAGSRIMPLLLALFIVTGLAAGVSLVGGCASTPQKAAYVTAGATQVTVDSAMTAWGDYVKLYHPAASQEMQVRDAFQRYQSAMLLLIDASQAYVTLAGAGSTNAPPAQARATAAQQQAAQAFADLLALLRSFGVKI